MCLVESIDRETLDTRLVRFHSFNGVANAHGSRTDWLTLKCDRAGRQPSGLNRSVGKHRTMWQRVTQT